MIKIYDDVLTSDEADDIEKNIISSQFPFYISESSGTVTDDLANEFKDNRYVKEHWQFVHTTIDYDPDTKKTIFNSDYSHSSIDLLNKFMNKLNVKNYNLARSKINFQPQYKNADKHSYNVPHTDMVDDHIVAIYYVNDSDGDTFIFDNNNKILKRITPKKGRFLLFDGSLKHAGSHPYYSKYRVVVNFDVYSNPALTNILS